MRPISTVLLFLSLVLFSCSNYTADLIIHNARIYTVNPSFDMASTMVIKDGRFIAVGEDELVDQYDAPSVLNLKGMPV